MILDGDLAEAVAAALTDAGVPYAVVVTRTTAGASDPSTPWIPGAPVVTPYACRGWADAYLADEIDGALILASDLKVIVLLPTIAVMPAAGDSVTVRGWQYGVISVQTDPALATATLQARA